MKAVKICVLTALMMLAGYAQQGGSRETDKSRVLALETAWNEAEKNKDVNALAALLAPTFSYTDSDGTFSNREQYLEGIKDAGYHPEQIVNESMTAQVYDRAAVVTGSYREKGSDKGKAYSRRGRFTDVWVQDGGRWLCAASHETLIARQP
jgi:ketosteroid isomerase-like protein